MQNYFKNNIYGSIWKSLRATFSKIWAYNAQILKKLLLKNAYFINFHHENLSLYNIVRARSLRALDIEVDIENSSYFFNQDQDYDSLYIEYRSWFAHEFPFFTLLGYIFILSSLYIIISILFNHGIDTLFYDSAHPSGWQLKYPLVSEYLSFWGFIGMLYVFAIADLDDEFTIAYIRFFLAWDLKMWFHRTFLSVSNFEMIFIQHSKGRTSIKETFETDKGPVHLFKDEEVFFRKPESAIEHYYDNFWGSEELYDPQELLLTDNFKFYLGLQHTVALWSYLYLIQHRSHHDLYNLMESRRTQKSLNMRAYSLVRVQLGELRSRAEPFVETPDRIVSGLTNNNALSIQSYRVFANLKKANILGFLEVSVS